MKICEKLNKLLKDEERKTFTIYKLSKKERKACNGIKFVMAKETDGQSFQTITWNLDGDNGIMGVVMPNISRLVNELRQLATYEPLRVFKTKREVELTIQLRHITDTADYLAEKLQETTDKLTEYKSRDNVAIGEEKEELILTEL